MPIGNLHGSESEQRSPTSGHSLGTWHSSLFFGVSAESTYTSQQPTRRVGNSSIVGKLEQTHDSEIEGQKKKRRDGSSRVATVVHACINNTRREKTLGDLEQPRGRPNL